MIINLIEIIQYKPSQAIQIQNCKESVMNFEA